MKHPIDQADRSTKITARRNDRAKRLSDKLSQVYAKVPKLYQDLFARVALGEASPRDAIKAKCQECCGYEEAVDRISSCGIVRCPLWAYRPYQKRDDTDPLIADQS